MSNVLRKRKKLRIKPLDDDPKPPQEDKQMVQKELFPEEPELLSQQQKTDCAETLRANCRGFRLKFWDLGSQRRLGDHEIAGMAAQLEMSAEQLSATKRLYARHETLTRKNSAKTAIQEAFKSATLPFPEPGVRLYPLKSKIEPEMTSEEIEKVYAEELSEFERMIQGHIDVFHKRVGEMANEWDSILASAKERLRKQFDPRLYPTADKLAKAIGCEFRAYNLTLPPEYRYVDPIVRQREMSILQAQYQLAAEKQAEVIQYALDDAIQQFIGSVSGFDRSTQRSFKTSVVTRVFDAVSEFREKCVRFGILDGTKVQEVFDKALLVMKGGGGSAETAANNLRNDVDIRKRVLSGIQDIAKALGEVSEPVARRRLKIQQSGRYVGNEDDEE